MIQIIEISATDTYVVRNAVLRKGKPIETCLFPGDGITNNKTLWPFYRYAYWGYLLISKPKHAFLHHPPKFR